MIGDLGFEVSFNHIIWVLEMPLEQIFEVRPAAYLQAERLALCVKPRFVPLTRTVLADGHVPL